MKSPVKLGENRFLGGISSSSIRNLLPRSISTKPKANPKLDAKPFRSNDENAPPVDANVEADHSSMRITKQSSPKSLSSVSGVLESHGPVEALTSLEGKVQVRRTGPGTLAEEKETLQKPSKVEANGLLSPERSNSAPNEISEECEPLGDQIRHLKEELIRTKSDGYRRDISRSGYFARDSLSQLRVSINRSLAMSSTNPDDPEEQKMKMDDRDVHDLSNHIQKFHTPDVNSTQSSFESASCEAELMSDDEIISEDSDKTLHEHNSRICIEDNGISVRLPRPAQILEEPTFSESPKIRSCHKSLNASTMFQASPRNVSESSIDGNPKQAEKLSLPTESLAASLQKGLDMINYHQRSSVSNRSSVSFSFEHLTLFKEDKPQEGGLSAVSHCSSCRQKLHPINEEGNDATEEDNMDEKHLKNTCMEQATKIEQLTRLLDQSKNGTLEEPRKLMKPSDGEDQTGVMKESYFDLSEREDLLKEIAELKNKLQPTKSSENLRSSLLLRSIQLRKSPQNDVLEREEEKWTEMESEWISLTDDLRMDIENHRRHAEELEMELRQEKKSTEELNDALSRAVLGHSRFIEQYTELQEMYNELAEKHHVMMEGIADMKKAAARAATNGRHGKRFAKSFTAELAAIGAGREKEREMLKKENKCLKAQLRDTAEAVEAAGELLVRLRESEHALLTSEEQLRSVEEDNVKLKKQIEKAKSKHKSEMSTMKQYLAESRLPGSALQPWWHNEKEEEEEEEAESGGYTTSAAPQYDDDDHHHVDDDDEAWRAEFGAIYQDHHHY